MLCSLRNKGLKLAVVTDAHNGNAAKRLEKAGLLGYFDAVITAEMSGRPKPAPDSFLHALGMLGVQPGHTVLVGDSIHREIGPGNNLGMITIYAAYGDRWYREGEDGGARHIVHDVREIGTVIDHHLIER
jgi:putative hydrolase of the HAD superfamily